MAELSESQLILLDNLIYLKDVANKNEMTVGDIVDYMLEENGLEKSRNPYKAGTADEYPCKMSKGEWLTILNAIDKDPQLKTLTVTHGEIGKVYDKNGQVIVNDKGEPIEVGMRAATFYDPATKEATVVFRGTGGDYEWHDNGTGGYLSDTEQQKAALQYIEGLPYENITVTGHSKGGNKTQYVAILSDKVDRAVSFDGQGFSKEFLEKYKDQIEANGHKIVSISAESDFVNCLLNPIAGTIKYIDTEKQEEFIFNHRPNIVLDKNGQLREVTERSAISSLINDLTIYLNANMEEPDRSYAIDGLLALMESGEEGFLKESDAQTKESIKLVLPYLGDYLVEHAVDAGKDFAGLVVTRFLALVFPRYFMDDYLRSLAINANNIKYLVDLGSEIGELLKDLIVDKLNEFLSNIAVKIANTAQHISAAIMGFVQQIKNGWNRLVNGIKEMAGKIKDAAVNAAEAIVRFKDKVVQSVQSFCNSIAEGTKRAMDAVKNAWNKAVDKVSGFFNRAKEKISEAYDDFKTGVQTMAKLTAKKIKDFGKQAAFSVKSFVNKVAKGLSSASKGLLLVNMARLDDLQSKLKNLDSDIETRSSQIVNEAQRVASGVSRSYSEANVQNQVRLVQKSCDEVRERSRRISAELGRKITSLTVAREQYIKLEAMIKSGIHHGKL
ncbi:Mbeg1-like protein [Fontibacillus sp. BL9]|uniref:Mbeg1-like protein n=1 Tax=Fontibacillus sp. BL9 TaxID=3389971 RepID=UPI00397CDFBC